jgi:hypothetical protein
VVGGALLVGSSFESWCHDYEVQRARSPSGRLDAVLTEGSCGATTSLSYTIHVVPRTADWSKTPVAASLYGALRDSSAYGVNLAWRGDTTVVGEYWQGREPFLPHRWIHIGADSIQIRLQAGVRDSTAPPGHMRPRTLNPP